MILHFLIIAACILADQITKILAVEYLTKIDTYPLIEDIFHFTYVENRGAAFGMLADHRWVFMILSTVGIAAMLVFLCFQKKDIMWNRIALCFIIGGGIGNMIDRIRLGYVVDFIDCRFIDFYVFNIADSFVCVGCVMYLIGIIYVEYKNSKQKKLSSPGGAEQ